MRLPLWASATGAAVVPVDRLRVLPAAAAGGRVAHVADRHLAGERLQAALVEDLGDQAEVALGRDVAAARRSRCRPTPGRGAGARRARSRRAGRRRARARRRRTRRTRRAARRARRVCGFHGRTRDCAPASRTRALAACSREPVREAQSLKRLSCLLDRHVDPSSAGRDSDVARRPPCRAPGSRRRRPRRAELHQRLARARDHDAARALAEQRGARVDLGAAQQRLEVERRARRRPRARTRRRSTRGRPRRRRARCAATPARTASRTSSSASRTAARSKGGSSPAQLRRAAAPARSRAARRERARSARPCRARPRRARGTRSGRRAAGSGSSPTMPTTGVG